MEKTAAVMVVALFLTVLHYSRAEEYTVGDSDEWTLGQNYTEWAASKTFVVGDTLKFVFGSSHDVAEVIKASYDSCNPSNTITVNNTSPITFPLPVVGMRYFICTISNHCSQGMKVAITVSASSVTPVTPTPPTVTPNGAGGLSVRVMVVEMAVAVAAFVLFLA